MRKHTWILGTKKPRQACCRAKMLSPTKCSSRGFLCLSMTLPGCETIRSSYARYAYLEIGRDSWKKLHNCSVLHPCNCSPLTEQQRYGFKPCMWSQKRLPRVESTTPQSPARVGIIPVENHGLNEMVEVRFAHLMRQCLLEMLKLCLPY